MFVHYQISKIYYKMKRVNHAQIFRAHRKARDAVSATPLVLQENRNFCKQNNKSETEDKLSFSSRAPVTSLADLWKVGN